MITEKVGSNDAGTVQIFITSLISSICKASGSENV